MDFSEYEKLNALARKTQEIAASSMQFQAQILKSIRPSLELQQQLMGYANLVQERNRYAPLMAPFAGISASVQQVAERLNHDLQYQLGHLKNPKVQLPLFELAHQLPSLSVLKNLGPLWAGEQTGFVRALQKFADEIQNRQGVDASPVLSLGWHLTPCMDNADLFEALSISSDEDRDAYMAERVQGYLGEIMSDVLVALTEKADRFGGEIVASHRKRHISSVFDAHKEGKYGLAIPSLFAQIEGVSLAGLGEPLDGDGFFFSSNLKAREEGLEPLTRVAGAFKPLEAPLLGVSAYGDPIRKYLAGERRCPNRHAVLHGRDLEFDTEMNSLKVITLLGYVTWLVGEVERDLGSEQLDTDHENFV